MKNLLSLVTTLLIGGAFIALVALTLNKVPNASNQYAKLLIEMQERNK